MGPEQADHFQNRVPQQTIHFLLGNLLQDKKIFSRIFIQVQEQYVTFTIKCTDL